MRINSIADLFDTAASLTVAGTEIAAVSVMALGSGLWAPLAVRHLAKLDLETDWEDTMSSKNGGTFYSPDTHLKAITGGAALGLLGAVATIGMATVNTFSGGTLSQLLASYVAGAGMTVGGAAVGGHLYTGLEMAGFGLRNLFNRSHDNQPEPTPAVTEEPTVSRRGLRVLPAEPQVAPKV